MRFSLDIVQDDIMAFLDENLAQHVEYHSFVDYELVARNRRGGIRSFYVVSFGDLQSKWRFSMAGARGDDYEMPIYIQAVSDDPDVARQLQNHVTNLLLGKSFRFSGQVRKRPGGNMWPVANSDNATEAYSAAASFGLLVQVVNVGT